MLASLAPLAVMAALVGPALVPGIIARRSFDRENR